MLNYSNCFAVLQADTELFRLGSFFHTIWHWLMNFKYVWS